MDTLHGDIISNVLHFAVYTTNTEVACSLAASGSSKCPCFSINVKGPESDGQALGLKTLTSKYASWLLVHIISRCNRSCHYCSFIVCVCTMTYLWSSSNNQIQRHPFSWQTLQCEVFISKRKSNTHCIITHCSPCFMNNIGTITRTFPSVGRYVLKP